MAAAAAVTCAVMASSTTFESGGVETSIERLLAASPPGAVEVAAAEKFAGIVTTAW